jgi:OOP family OmpA-OmpF porin
MQGCRALSPCWGLRALDRITPIARVVLALALGLALVLTGSVAAAQSTREPIDVERFKPAVTSDGFIDLEGSGVRSTADRWAFGLALNYALNPLVTINEQDQIVDRFVSGRLGADVMASVTLFEPMALGIDIPFFLAQTGDESPSFGGLGDVRLVPKVRLLDDRELFGLALVGELRVPTHAGDFAGGARNVVFVPKLVADHRFGFGLRLGTNLGAALREQTTFENVEAASEFVYGAALSYRIGGWRGPVEIGAEAEGGVGFVAVDFEELPLETRLFAKIYPTPEW